MNEPSTKVSIIVVNYNTPELVRALIDSIKEFTRQIDYEVIVFNNGCKPNGKFAVGGYNVLLRSIDSEEHLWFVRASNAAVEPRDMTYVSFAGS